jgi:branched-chain amino acid transport system substrate-binding protein
MMISQLTGTDFSAPETQPVAQAAVKQINAQGGLDGHPVNLIVCDDKESPTVNAACARTAVSDKAIAVVEGISISGTGGIPILQAAGIADINTPNLSIQDTSPVSLPLTSELATYAGAGMLLATRGCKKIAIVTNSEPLGQVGGHQITAGAEVDGATQVSFQTAAPTDADFSPIVATAIQSGAQCIGASTTPTQSIALMTAIHQSSKPTIPIGTIEEGFPPALVQKLGSSANNLLVTSPSYLPSDSQASGFVNLVKSFGGGAADESGFAEDAYSGFSALTSIAANVSGDLTSASFLAAANKATGLKVALYPQPLSWATPNPVKEFSRNTNPWVLAYAWDNTAYKLIANGELINTKAAFAKYAASPSS